MLFIVQFEDVYSEQPERLPERAQHMSAHLTFLAENSGRLVAAGALRPSPDEIPIGGIWIISADDKVAVEDFYKGDPFWKAGLRKSVCVSHWAKAFWSPAFTDCAAAFGVT
jgi:uncharacterized protein YciI